MVETMPSSPRRFPPPWSAELTPNCFIVRDADGQALSYVYYESEPGRRSAAKLLTRHKAGRAPYGGKGCGFKCRMTLPSEMVGLAAPVSRAFLVIQSRAARVLSSVPVLSRQTVTENPPLEVRTSE